MRRYEILKILILFNNSSHASRHLELYDDVLSQYHFEPNCVVNFYYGPFATYYNTPTLPQMDVIALKKQA